MGVELPALAMFDAPTLGALAARIESARLERGSGDHIELPALVRVDRSSPLALSFAQSRQVSVWVFAPTSSRYNLPVALRFKGPLDLGLLERSVREIVCRHEALRTTFSVSDDVDPLQIIHPESASKGPGVFEHVDLRAVKDPEAAAKARLHAEAKKTFDLSVDIPIRATALTVADDNHLLMLNIQHVAADAWSLAIVFRELRELYAA